MKTVKFHFYISGDYDSAISRIIGEVGWLANRKDILKYCGRKILISHEEVEFCDRWYPCPDALFEVGTIFPQQEYIPCPACVKGVLFSSATRGNKTGVRFAPSSEVLKNPERWISIAVQLPDEVEQRMFDAAKSIEGAGYDYIGVLFKLTPFDIFQAWWRWYCSEACNWIASKSDEIIKHPKRWISIAESTIWGREFNVYHWQRWHKCYSKHRRISPSANLILMLKNGYKIEDGQIIMP